MSSLPLAASQLEAARSQMAFTLGFHIILASVGVGFPAMMLIANYIGLRRGDEHALLLARRWSKVVAGPFAPGAGAGAAPALRVRTRCSSPGAGRRSWR